MHTPVLDPRPGPTTEKPPPLPARNRAVIALHASIVAAATMGYLIAGTITGNWTPHPWPAGLMTIYFLGVAGISCYAVWQGVTGRASIDTESLDAIKSHCAHEATRRPGPASAVAMRPLLPHPCSGYVYAAVTAKRLGASAGAPGTSDVSLRTTPGWAFTRRTAWHRGLVLTGHPALPRHRRLGTMEDPATPHKPLTGPHSFARSHCN